MKVISIAAVAKNGVIGNGLELPWKIPEDYKFFLNSTIGHIVIMGRKTLDALGKPMSKRENAIITRNSELKVDGARVFSDVKTAIEYYRAHEKDFPNQNIFVIGGAQIYEAAMDLVDEVWLTEIDHSFDGDVFFPFYQEGKFLRTEFKRAESHPQKDLSSPFLYRFNRFSR
jgi:dihydrofolate reductase